MCCRFQDSGDGNLWAGPRRERLQVGGASCPGSRWERRRRWAQLNRGGKSGQERGLVKQGQEGELAHLGCPRGGLGPGPSTLRVSSFNSSKSPRKSVLSPFY